MAASVFLIYGDDEYRVSEKARQVVDALVPVEDRAFGLEIIEGRCDTAAEAEEALNRTLEAIRTVGFLSSRKTVWLRDANFLADGNVARSDLVKSRLAVLVEEIKSGLSSGHTFVLTSPKVDGRSSLAKVCGRMGEAHELSIPDKGYLAEKMAVKTLGENLQKMGLDMPQEARDVFLAKVGTDTRQLINELDKLCAYLGDRRRAELEDVEAITSSSRGALAWDLADAFGKRQLPQALVVLRRLLFRKESPVGLIMAIESRIRDLMVYREALDQGWLRAGRNVRWTVPPEVDDLLSNAFDRDPRAAHPFRAGLLASQAQGFSMPHLKRCHRAVREAHKKLVSRSVPRDLVLEILLLRLLA